MKVLSLISTVLLALSLSSAVQAAPAAPATNNNVAPATIVLAQCEANDPTPCGISSAPAKTGDAEQNALAPTDAKQQAQNEPATPVPEPQTFIMLMLGLVVLGFASRRRQASEKFSD